MTTEVINSSEDKLKKSLDALKKDYGTLRAGRATPSLLDKVMVDYYGTPTPVNQMASVTVPEARMIMIKPYDKGSLKDIEKAIFAANLGLTPMNEGTQIRINVPPLTEERRKEYTVRVAKEAEDAKVAVRNIRRDANDKIKKDKTIPEDTSKDMVEQVQKITDEAIKKIDEIKVRKDKEIMTV